MAPVQKKVKKPIVDVKKVSTTFPDPVPDPESKKLVKRKRTKRMYGGNFQIYIHRVLLQVHPELAISKSAMSIMNSFVNDIFERILAESVVIVNMTKTRTISSAVMETATSLVIQGELAKHAVCEGRKAMIKYANID